MTPTQIMNGPAKEVAQYIATAPLNDSYNLTGAAINAMNRIHALEQQVQNLAAAPQLTPEERSATEAINPNGKTPMTDMAEIIFCPPHTRIVELNRCQDIERKYNWAMANWNDCRAELQATKEDLGKANQARFTAQWRLQKSQESEQRLACEVALFQQQAAAAYPKSVPIVMELRQELAAANEKLMKASVMGIDAHAELSRCRVDNQAKCDELARKLGFSEIQLAALREQIQRLEAELAGVRRELEAKVKLLDSMWP